MNNGLVLLGAIFLVVGVMGFLYASDQADAHYMNALFSGKSHSSDYGIWKLGTYAMAGLSVLGGVMCAAGIFTTPKPDPNPEPDAFAVKQPKKPLDEATRKEYKRKYLKSGGKTLVFAAVALGLAYLLSLLLPSTLIILCQLIAGIGLLAAIYGLFLIVTAVIAL